LAICYPFSWHATIYISKRARTIPLLAAELTNAGYPTEEVFSMAECHEILSNPLVSVTAV
jgi:hypothetical protein